MADSIGTLFVDVAAVLGAVSALSTLLAHMPFMPKPAASFLARVGVAFSKFDVSQKPATPKAE